MGLDGFWHVIQQLSLKGPAMMDEAGPLQLSSCWLAHPAVRGVVSESFESFFAAASVFKTL